MKKALLVWIGIVMAFIAVAGVLVAVDGNYIGGSITALLFGAAALRTWYIAGDSTKPPTGVEG